MKRTVGKRADLNKPATKGDLEDMAAHIVLAISKTLEENHPTKDDLARVERRLEEKIDRVAANVSDIRRRVIDLEVDTVKRREFEDFKQKIAPKLL